MMRRQNEQQAGQVLAQVALMMVVLLGFLALAVDVGQVYFKRRQLQNAADAGALEGARQICFVPGATTASAEAEARAEALANAPGAYPPVASRSDWQMTVVVSDSIPSFAASILGIGEFGPGARATAVCGAADRNVGGLWPLSVYEDEFEDISCDEVFTVFTDGNGNQAVDCVNQCDCNTLVPSNNPNDQYPSTQVIATLLAGGAPTRIGSGDRAWLQLFDPPDPLPDQCGPNHSCGSSERDCWLQYTHPGPLSCGDQIPAQPGIAWTQGNGPPQGPPSMKSAVEYHVDHNSIINIPLWVEPEDLTCGPLGEPVGSCTSNDMYTINSFGCISILGYGTFTIPPRPPANNCQYGSNVKVIFAKRLCDCQTFSGGTGGDPFGNGTRAVSLIE